MTINIGDQRKAGEDGPAGDQRKAGEAGPAGDPRPAGEAKAEAATDESKQSDDQEAEKVTVKVATKGNPKSK